jgi:beta-phosphoglucomutase
MKAVIFDLDGVLTSTVDHHFQSWKQVLGAFDIEISDEVKDKLLGLSRRRSLEIILGEREVTEERLHEILRLKNECYLELIEKMGPRDLPEGVSILLQEIHFARVKIGVASASQNVSPILHHLGIDGFFQAIADGVKVKRSKPAPDVFLHSARTLNVRPEECLAIEDGAAGVLAARAAGMVVLGLGPEDRVGEAHAVRDDLSHVHLKDLQEIYRRWCGNHYLPEPLRVYPQAV